MTDSYRAPIAASRICVRAGAIKLERMGSLSWRDQHTGRYADRAPEPRGIWAFVFPYYDAFFTWHKWEEVLPKHLLDSRLQALLEDESTPRADIEQLHLGRDEWIKSHRDIMKLRRFWWEGDIYARFDQYGKNISSSAWHLMPVSVFEAAARKVEPKNYWSSDHMEVFIAPHRGKLVER
jgi:hypothetical protein